MARSLGEYFTAKKAYQRFSRQRRRALVPKGPSITRG